MTGLAQAAGPALLTLLLIGGGGAGWATLAAVLAATGSAVPALTRRAARPGTASSGVRVSVGAVRRFAKRYETAHLAVGVR